MGNYRIADDAKEAFHPWGTAMDTSGSNSAFGDKRGKILEMILSGGKYGRKKQTNTKYSGAGKK